MGILDKIKDIETEMARTQKNKGNLFSEHVKSAVLCVGMHLERLEV